MPRDPGFGQSECACGFNLASWHRLDPRAEYFRQVCSSRQCQGENAARWPGELYVQEKGSAVVDPEDHHGLGQTAKDSDIYVGEVIDNAAPENSAGANEESYGNAEEKGCGNEDQGHPESLEEDREGIQDDLEFEGHLTLCLLVEGFEPIRGATETVAKDEIHQAHEGQGLNRLEGIHADSRCHGHQLPDRKEDENGAAFEVPDRNICKWRNYNFDCLRQDDLDPSGPARKAKRSRRFPLALRNCLDS